MTCSFAYLIEFIFQYPTRRDKLLRVKCAEKWCFITPYVSKSADKWIWLDFKSRNLRCGTSSHLFEFLGTKHAFQDFSSSWFGLILLDLTVLIREARSCFLKNEYDTVTFKQFLQMFSWIFGIIENIPDLLSDKLGMES